MFAYTEQMRNGDFSFVWNCLEIANVIRQFVLSTVVIFYGKVFSIMLNIQITNFKI